MSGRVALILLAAGASRRMGRCKPLLPLGDKPVIAHCLDALVDAGIGTGVVVTSGDADGTAVAAVVRGYRLSAVCNPAPDADMAGSVRIGLAALAGVREDASGIMIGLADQPLVRRETIRFLLREHAATPGNILIPVFAGRRGHPTVFPAPLLQAMRGGGTLRDLIRGHAAVVREVPVDDPGVIADMDTPEDYQALCRHFAEGAALGDAGS